jgi:hypothetical protein
MHDMAYSLNNIGLEITQRVRKVIPLENLVLLEVLLDCRYEDTNCKVSITVIGSKPFYNSVIARETESSLKDYRRLPVIRVDPRFLGSVEFEYGNMSIDIYDDEVALQIWPISVDSD